MNLLKEIRTKVASLLYSLKDMPYLPRWAVFVMDILICTVAFTLTHLICVNLQGAYFDPTSFLLKLGVCLTLSTFYFVIFKTYSGIIRYATYIDALKVLYTVLCINVTLMFVNYGFALFAHKTIFVWLGFFINATLTFVFMFFFRMFVKLLYDYVLNNAPSSQKRIPVLIFGVNSTTVPLAKMIKNDSTIRYRLAGFISLDRGMARKRLMNVPVFYDQDEYLNYSKKHRIRTIVVASTEVSKDIKENLVDFCMKNNIEILSAPHISKWKNDKTQIREMKQIQIEDLLGRESIQIDTKGIAASIEGKCVMVTGAAGSIGSEIARQLSQFNPKILLLCDIAESPLHQLRLELQDDFPQLTFYPLICDVRNYERMKTIFEKYRPQHVYHAAAYKHVPLMEEFPFEAIVTNVLGTKNIADLAAEYNAEAFVMISTDKAVNPSNVMGASKRIAEIYVQSLGKRLEEAKDKQHNTRFITTRFGNVLGSNGSVIPLFKNQIAKGGPVTVTHPDIIRYFMTIPEACRLVLEAANMGKGGEIFVFDMGEPVRIVALAEKMIRLAGFVPNKDIMIEFSGLRPGEKLYEELLNDKEQTKPTHNEKIMIGTVRECDYAETLVKIQKLIAEAHCFNSTEVVRVMKHIVSDFKSNNSIYEELDKEFEKDKNTDMVSVPEESL